MRIVFIRSNPVTPDPRVEKEANTLVELGHKVNILAWNRMTDGNKYPKSGMLSLKNNNIPIRWFNIKATFGGGIKNLFSLLIFQMVLLIWLIKHRKDYDVIHACDFDTVIPAFISSKLFRKKYVYDIFDYYIEAYHVPNLLKPLVEKLDIQMINKADGVIIVNESREHQIRKSHPTKLCVIHNSPEMTSNLQKEPGVIKDPSNKLKFVYVGILGKGRMLEEIIEIFEKNQQFELHIGGFGELEEYVLNKSETSSNIFFYGKIPYHLTLKLESQCDVLFAIYDPSVPNHKYTSPNKLYEAMMLGKPIIVAKETGIDELVQTHGIGKVIAFNKESFEQACKDIELELQNNTQIAEKMRFLYKNQFSWDIMRDRLNALYRGLLK